MAIGIALLEEILDHMLLIKLNIISIFILDNMDFYYLKQLKVVDYSYLKYLFIHLYTLSFINKSIH
jgi:hypothetical protein